MAGSQESLDIASLVRLGEIVADRTGLRFAPERRGELERAVRAATPALGFEDAAACLHRLVSRPLGKRQIEILATHLTVGETYFFRDKTAFDTLITRILPELMRARRKMGQRTLRFWSAGCCSGEEAYSLAIALDRALTSSALGLGDNWRVSVLATDINPEFLRRAREGVYREWSFRDAPPFLKTRYFEPVGDGRYRIVQSIRSMVAFAPLNLAEASYPALATGTTGIDVIVCRNVLIYFGQEQIQSIVEKFHRCLTDGGWLWVAASEATQALFPGFEPLHPGTVWFRKSNAVNNAAINNDAFNHNVGIGTAGEFQTAAQKVAAAFTASLAGELAQREEQDSRASETPVAGSGSLEEALAYYKRGDYNAAAQILETMLPGGSVKTERMPGGVLPFLVRAWINAGQPARALACCDQALAADKLNPELHLLRATVLQEDGDVVGALNALRRALYLDHDYVMAHFTLGQLFRRQGRTADATRHFQTARQLVAQLDPNEILPGSEEITAGRLAGLLAVLEV